MDICKLVLQGEVFPYWVAGCVCVQGCAATQMQQVGNAVPFLMGWAIMSSVYKAAYGVEPPKPSFLARLQKSAGVLFSAVTCASMLSWTVRYC